MGVAGGVEGELIELVGVPRHLEDELVEHTVVVDSEFLSSLDHLSD